MSKKFTLIIFTLFELIVTYHIIIRIIVLLFININLSVTSKTFKYKLFHSMMK